jgi:hypothetical protein
LVAHRVFPDFTRIPALLGRRVEGFSFIHGKLKLGGRPQALFQELAQGPGVTPFLFATNGAEVLMAALSTDSSGAGTPGGGRGPSVLGTLERFLTDVEVNRERLEAVNMVVDHRYDRLFGGDGRPA